MMVNLFTMTVNATTSVRQQGNTYDIRRLKYRYVRPTFIGL